MSTKRGQAGEERAVSYLRRKGYTILGRNIRLGRGELDIVAKDRELLAFVEVKAHKSAESALLAVHPDKCERLKSAAGIWLSQHPESSRLQCRFDLIIVSPRVGLTKWMSPHIEHMKDVIR